jgi:hypothetical protein
VRHSGRHTAAISRGRPLLLHSDRRGHRRSAPPGAQRSQVLRVESVGVLYLARESGCRALQCGGVRALRSSRRSCRRDRVDSRLSRDDA